jgi:predicted HNH restriction endonuclease
MNKPCCHCGLPTKRSSYRYCSNRCQLDFQYQSYVSRWKEGKVSGSRGINTKNISAHIRRYLYEKYSNSCSACRWSKIHPATAKVMLEIHHIDGNPNNNSEENLLLLCPNCHSLTHNFKNLNAGHGRTWRKLRYNKST